MSATDESEREKGRAPEPGQAAPASFLELYEPVAPAIFAWASLHLGEDLRLRLDPEDVLQEVSCRAFERFGQFDAQRGSFRAWAFGIARNVLLQAMRRMGSGAEAASSALDARAQGELPDPATTITRKVAKRDALRLLMARVDGLDESDRRLVLHRGLEGLPHEDVGALLGLAPSTSAKRWERLLKRLREEVAGLDFFEA